MKNRIEDKQLEKAGSYITKNRWYDEVTTNKTQKESESCLRSID